MNARRLVTAGLVAAATLLFAQSASATLRATPLETTCSSGYTYQEQLFALWRVEGCGKAGTNVGSESKHWTFKGTLEVNGLIVEAGSATTASAARRSLRVEAPGSGPTKPNAILGPGAGDSSTLLVATVDGNVGRIKRTSTSTKIVLDPLVGGVRKQFTLYTGALDLSATKASTAPDTSFSKPPVTQFASAKARSAITVTGNDKVDIPITGTPKIFGLRLREALYDATVTATSISFDAQLSLGTGGVSDLLSDVSGETPMTVTDGSGLAATSIKVDFPLIEIPGIGGLKQLDITYSSSADSWTGELELDLGDLFPGIDFEIEVDATTGAPIYIRTAVDNLNIPIGATGIVLDSVALAFGLDPLFISAGASATAGPKVGGTAIVAISGLIEIQFEPNFRLEVSGTARVFPSGNGELATGSLEIIFDSAGLIAVGGDARFEAAVAGIGIGAEISGSGAYSTTANKFNIEASATGELLLGFLGDFEVARFEAVVSSNGWGTCGKVLAFVSGGIGQDWDTGLEVFTGCDLDPFDAPIPGAFARTAQQRPRTRSFKVLPGTKQVGIELTADRPGPRVALTGPSGRTLQTTAGQRGTVGENVVVLSKPDTNVQFVFLQNPPPGDYTVAWEADAPQITGLRTARDAEVLKATAKVSRKAGDRPGRRRVTLQRSSKLARGEKLMVGVRTPKGLVELGEPTDAASFTFTYDETVAGNREIVAVPMRNGIPIASRKAVIGRFTSTMPPRPAAIRKRRKGNRIQLLARVRPGAEAPDGWQYRVRATRGRTLFVRGKVGKPVTVRLPRRIKSVKVTARPVVRGRALR